MSTSAISVFDLFKIGVGPSSSHTVGPMVAARRFCHWVEQTWPRETITGVRIELFGSLALTGIGHRTDRAIVAGLQSAEPETVDPDWIESAFLDVQRTGRLRWLGHHPIAFDLRTDLVWRRGEFLPEHSNAMQFTARSADGTECSRRYFSVGGGFVVDQEELATGQTSAGSIPDPPMPFATAAELLDLCHRHGLSIADVVLRNEMAVRDASQIASNLDRIWETMQQSIQAGCTTEGVLPGGLEIRRRAPEIYKKLEPRMPDHAAGDHLALLDWVDMFALAVNEQNAAGGRVVTAPTNGAAGIIPAVLGYYVRFVPGADRSGVHQFLLTSAAIGSLYKRNASLSAAEMGCQGEVGVACSMAAAGLAAVMGGTPGQIENAAEIGMEHNLGLTCDPVAGLVQIPCIERNTMGAVKAINAARLAVLYGDGRHRVALDRVIETMRQTGLDMQTKYKETSLGGLAVNIINC